jgi:hypothetical protein
MGGQASGAKYQRQADDMNVQHPVLGDCDAIPYDRTRKFLGVLIGAAIVAIGLDTTVIGMPVVVSIVLVVGGVLLGAESVRRVRMQVCLLLGDPGFESFPGIGPVFWKDVALIGVGQLRWSPFMRTHVVLVQLAQPAVFLATHKLNFFRKLALRLDLRLQQGHLGLDLSETATSAGKAVGLMQARLWAYRQSSSTESATRSGPKPA